SDTSTGLIVDFGSLDCEKVVFTEKESLNSLRIRSTPIQGDECLHIREGDRVLAGHNTHVGDLFFDAEVEKVCRVRHSKRNKCRCTFEIKWLYLHREAETVTVPASSIMKLATESVDIHPTINEFLNSVETIIYSGASSFVSLFDETVFDSDILEKQIEEISRVADVSREGCQEDCSLELAKVVLTGQVNHRTTASQVNFLQDQGPHDQNNSRRTTRSQRKLQETKQILPPQLVIKEPSRSNLSPLGARAVLASRMYILPSEPESSTYDVETEPANHTTVISLDVNSTFMNSNVCIQDKVYMTEGLLSCVETCPDSVVLKPTEVNISKRRNASNKFLSTTLMQNRLKEPAWKPNDTEDMISHTVTSKGSLKFSESPTKTTRLACSPMQKEIKASNTEVQVRSSPGEMKFCGSTNTRRFTRSIIQKESTNVIVEANKELQGRQIGQDLDRKLESPMKITRLIHSATQKGIEPSNDEALLKSSSEEMKLCSSTHTPRFTRSTMQKETTNVTVEAKKEWQELQDRLGTPLRATKLTHLAMQNGSGLLNGEVELKSFCEEMKLHGSIHRPRFTRSTMKREIRDVTVEANSKFQGRHIAQDKDSPLTLLTDQSRIEHLHKESVLKSSDEIMRLQNPTHMPRLTRSATKNEAKNVPMEINEGLEESKVIQDMCSDSTKENNVTPQTKETRWRKPLSSSSDDDEIILFFSQESKKKQRVSNDVTSSEGEISEASACLKGTKKSVKPKPKPKMRFSPRLSSLPRTSSQK
ncbi:hypothetical protein FRX31_017943, partial [Thalictrum thalictroides]